MATEEKKKENLLEMLSYTVFGLAQGMWELFGDSSFATSTTIGDMMVARAEKAAGLEVQGETPDEILTEIVRLSVDELGLMEDGKAVFTGDHITIECDHCKGCTMCNGLQSHGVQPFYCSMFCMASSALREGTGHKNRFLSRKYDEGTKTCTIEIQTMQ
ncbi:hypothetical protein LARV_00324 [Longilinea arvoryzae]|uniref:Metanogen output domain-containing protein n=1 Tax=Longilinea arvoryzae TaxID=360412 RepID=A0A0S7B5Z3_9CHLR|nr:hypothetical protein [Longilinea arvoryzae]GAP12588.1 hypothetical protein LARV_00324 [Longilinea arvoryzae]